MVSPKIIPDEVQRSAMYSGGNSANPLDPSPRTMEQMGQAVSGLKELMLTRMQSYDEAIKLLQDFANRQPTPGEIYKELMALKELTATRFDERDRRFEVRHDDDRTMVKDALIAAKEATSKSEAAFSEQVRSITDTIRLGNMATESRLTDIKERIDRGEGVGSGAKQSYGVISAIVGIAMTAVIVAVAVINLIIKG